MIAKLFRNNQLKNIFFCSTFKPRKQATAQMPQIIFPTKPKPAEDERLPSSLAYELMKYVKGDRLPNCRYFAVEYKNRIHHFYNAYYYPLGRMINRVATAIRGRNSPLYRNDKADVKNGDVCVIVNIEDPLVTGKKLLFKKLRYHTGFIGHLKEFSYRHVLNHKPQLLYYYLIRKAVPKNKLSAKYMQNLILIRGPVHGFPSIPQFAPDKRVYDTIQDINLMEYLKKSQQIKIVSEYPQNAAKKIFGKQFEIYQSEHDKKKKINESEENIENIAKVHQDLPKYIQKEKISKKKYQALVNREKKIEERYRQVRAPYKKKQKKDIGIEYFTSQKKARKHPQYELLANEELQQIDDENTHPEIHVIGGANEDPKKPW